jgi:hypothetical protein
MDKYKRLQQLEWKLDNEDLTDEQFTIINREYNELQDDLEAPRAAAKAKREQECKEMAEAEELAKILSLTEEEVDRMYESACTTYQDVNGMSFKAWYEQSQKYYKIDDHYNVYAKARSSNTVEVVPHPTLAQAKLLILNRIKYKFYDHAVRGHDFAYELD